MIKAFFGFVFAVLLLLSSIVGTHASYLLMTTTDKWWVGLFGILGLLFMIFIMLLSVLLVAYSFMRFVEEI